MATIRQIDPNLPVTIFPMIQRQLDDPEMVSLANSVGNPRLLLCDFPLDGEPQHQVTDTEQTTALLAWLDSHEIWGPEIEHTLQSLSQDDQGREHLTAFMPPEVFEHLAKHLELSGYLPGLGQLITEWRAQGATNIYFEGYRRTFQVC